MQQLMKEKERMRHQVNDLVLPPSSSPPAGERERKIIIKRHVPLHMELTFRSRCWGHTYSLPHTHTHTGCAIIIGREKDEEKTTGGGKKL